MEKRQRGQREGTRTQMCLALQKRGRQYLKSEAGSVSDGLDRVPRIHLLLMPLPHRAAIYMARLFSYTSSTNNIFELHYIYKFKIKLCSKFIVKLPGLFFWVVFVKKKKKKIMIAVLTPIMNNPCHAFLSYSLIFVFNVLLAAISVH